jgi:uncharacterized membrane protein YciS (DUF1049 family)
MVDVKFCLELIVALAAVGAMWLRMEIRLTRLGERVQERYRDKAAEISRIEKIEKWLPKDKLQG